MDKETEAAIIAGIDTAAGIATTLAPQFAPYIILGTAVAKAAPTLYDDVVKLLQKAEPTADEKADLARKLYALAHPESP